MRLATAKQSARMDQLVQTDYGLTDQMVMEVAGSLAARELEQSFFPELSKGRVIFVAGPGHNGADAFVTARHLHGAGFRDLAVLCQTKDVQLSATTVIQRDRAKKFGISVIEDPAPAELRDVLLSATLIVDGIFGIGLSRIIQPPYAEWVEIINSSRSPCVALDVPSGLDVDTGEVMGVAVKAIATLTFGLPKPGFFTGNGPSFCGRLRVLPLGYPQELVRKMATTHFAFTEKLAKRYLPKPSERANKATQGFLQIFAGSKDYWGAGILSALAAYRLGAGYVQLSSFDDPTGVISQHPEILAQKIHLNESFLHPKAKAVAVGPGLGVHADVGRLIARLKEESQLPVVLDADALNFVNDLDGLPSHWVLTPHAGELGRMLNQDPVDIEKNRFHFVQMAAEKYGCVVLLKGFRTVMAYEDRLMVMLSGNSSLAKAGTGDVLTGMIGALLAQGLPTIQATGTASYLHGKLADDWVQQGQDRLSMTSGDLRELLPSLIARLRGEIWAPI